MLALQSSLLAMAQAASLIASASVHFGGETDIEFESVDPLLTQGADIDRSARSSYWVVNPLRYRRPAMRKASVNRLAASSEAHTA